MTFFHVFARLAPGEGVPGLAGDVNLIIFRDPTGPESISASATMTVHQARELADQLRDVADEAERGKPLTGAAEGSAL